MLKLHGSSVSNYTNMVKQCLLEKGIEFEQLPARPSQEDGFLAMSPMGKIPCLETADGFLIETSAILDYLDEVYPKPSTYPSQAFAKAKAREIIHVSEFGNADIFVYHVFRLASQILKRVYDWDIVTDVPGLAAHIAAMDERDTTKRVMADHEEAMVELMT